MKVCILKNWDFPDFMRQTPQGRGIWQDLEFTFDPSQACDAVFVLNSVAEDTEVNCPPGRVFNLVQEPPVHRYEIWHRGLPCYDKILTCDERHKRSARHILSQPALPWHVHRSYDQLVAQEPMEKSQEISWITSNKSHFPGHKRRMRLLEKLQGTLSFDLYGRPFRPIEDKWDALAPYRYSLAIENFSNPYYWTEKIADCFLSWTVPIVYGCTRITEYFPSEAMILIDPDDPKLVESIHEQIAQRPWDTRLEALGQARDLVLHRYQFFPFASAFLKDQLSREGAVSASLRQQLIPVNPARKTLRSRLSFC